MKEVEEAQRRARRETETSSVAGAAGVGACVRLGTHVQALTSPTVYTHLHTYRGVGDGQDVAAAQEPLPTARERQVAGPLHAIQRLCDSSQVNQAHTRTDYWSLMIKSSGRGSSRVVTFFLAARQGSCHSGF